MWALDNRTGYAAARNWARDKDGVHWWIVAVKATFDVSPQGRAVLADVQPEPVLAPEYFGDPGASSLRHDSDLLAPKPGTDVLAIAHAHAPGGRPATAVPVTLRVGALTKQLRVHGERTYDSLGVGLSAPEPFSTAPIRYEYAFGGFDTADPDPARQRMDERNPVGRGFVRRSLTRAGQLAHAIEYPDGDPADAGPAGFGPVDPSWSPRRQLAGTYDARWEQTRRPLLPADYDPEFAMSAPADQRAAGPVLGERVELHNMTPEGILRVEVPRVALAFTTRFGARRQEQPSRLTALILEPEERRLSLVWQSCLRVAAPDADYLDVTEIREHRGAA
ncbi:DUF2169 family type VI secretion system accessory protein [Nannocystis bainbridge]|uniref:DUF2169 domain-containing protein n=1 Tax=Nannocystis bainbridge TaxID=2995303 RepID=A0ABT5DQA3_9BACT|nr:DUF2169 domain-containing protein [Nannocystis bainbridge]MDC0715841.1 DUF2169 domain-containing protein [Nannocystis bainbridge]